MIDKDTLNVSRTGANFELLHKNTAVSKRHCKKWFYLELLAGKGSMCHVMQNGWH